MPSRMDMYVLHAREGPPSWHCRSRVGLKRRNFSRTSLEGLWSCTLRSIISLCLYFSLSAREQCILSASGLKRPAESEYVNWVMLKTSFVCLVTDAVLPVQCRDQTGWAPRAFSANNTGGTEVEKASEESYDLVSCGGLRLESCTCVL